MALYYACLSVLLNGFGKGAEWRLLLNLNRLMNCNLGKKFGGIHDFFLTL